MPPITHYLYFGLALFVVGLCGVVFRRSLIHVSMAFALMFGSVAVLLAAYARYHLDPGGRVLALVVVLVGLLESAIGAALILRIVRAEGGEPGVIDDWTSLGEHDR
jgi:NADH:ubiquinone oxidoreductase subunit K